MFPPASALTMAKEKHISLRNKLHALQILLHYLLRYANPSIFFLSFAPSLISLLLLPRFYVITFRPCLTFFCFATQHFEPTYPFISDPKCQQKLGHGGAILVQVRLLVNFRDSNAECWKRNSKKVAEKSSWMENKLSGCEQNYCTLFHIDTVAVDVI